VLAGDDLIYVDASESDRGQFRKKLFS